MYFSKTTYQRVKVPHTKSKMNQEYMGHIPEKFYIKVQTNKNDNLVSHLFTRNEIEYLFEKFETITGYLGGGSIKLYDEQNRLIKTSVINDGI